MLSWIAARRVSAFWRASAQAAQVSRCRSKSRLRSSSSSPSRYAPMSDRISSQRKIQASSIQTPFATDLFPGIFCGAFLSFECKPRTNSERKTNMSKSIHENPESDDVNRRGFLKCMAWAGTGALCVLQGGVLKSFALGEGLEQKIANMKADLSFVQISDTHMGFNKDANPDVTATLREAIAKINALPTPPAFVLHTGDLTHLSKPEEFDTLSETLKSLKTERIFYVPGEHDVLNDNGQMFRSRFAQQTQGDGWYSFDQKGAHFIGLVNVMNFKAGGL